MLPAYGIFHITVRGVDRCLIFRSTDDYRFFVALLRRLFQEGGLAAHAYCLMPNHAHVVVEGPMEAISRAFHRINGIHAQRFNTLYERVGHLFQDRFHTRVVESDEYLTNACEYAWDNPVRAGLCKTRREWAWSGRILSGENRRVPSGHGGGLTPVTSRGGTSGLDVDARFAGALEVVDPDVAEGGAGDEGGAADVNRRLDLVGLRVEARDRAVDVVRDPDAVVARLHTPSACRRRRCRRS